MNHIIREMEGYSATADNKYSTGDILLLKV